MDFVSDNARNTSWRARTTCAACRDLIFMLVPIMFIFTGVPAVRSATLSDYLWHFVPYAVLAIAAMWYSARGVTGLRGIVIGFGSFPALLGSLAAVVMGRKSSFAVTSKAGQRTRSFGYLFIYVVFAALCVFSIFWATRTHHAQQASLFISLLWVSYSLVLLGSFLWLAGEDLRLYRETRRADRELTSTAKLSYPSKLLERPTGLRPVWSLGLAAMIAVPLLVNTQLASLPVFADRHATPFAIAEEQRGAPYAGLSLPVQLLKSTPPRFERELGVHFSIIGRTQEIGDNFDRAWADDLAAQGARPWITLQFGEFGSGRKVPLEANLPAIVNGLRDDEIARWAREIRDFGHPVYLTVFLHADRNWSISSGVANGGIPSDVPKAWTHVQSIFRAIGADNVAWVWAPADPIHDREFAPPPSSIDAVLQSFINFPGTTWGDPQAVLRNLTRRYPGKPLFVEASAAGPPAEKAAWLSRLELAVDGSPQVHVLLYHEGGPGLAPSSDDAKNWSLASDAQSRAAMEHLITGLRASTRTR